MPGYDMGARFRSMYGDDGNTEITEDKYGQPLIVVKPQAVIDAMLKDMETVLPNPRYRLAVPLLSEALAIFGKYKKLRVILFGH